MGQVVIVMKKINRQTNGLNVKGYQFFLPFLFNFKAKMTMQVLGFHIPTEIMDIVAMIEKVNEIGMDLVIRTLHSVQPIQ